MSPKRRKKTPPAAPPPAPPPPLQGIACRRCGCRDLRVVYTRRRRTGILRRRQCRWCGHRVVTYEREAGESPRVPLA